MGTIAVGTAQLPVWGIVAVWAYIVYMFLSTARAEERRRREQGQPHTKLDTALLLLTALCVVGAILCAILLKPLNVLVKSRAGFAAMILFLAAAFALAQSDSSLLAAQLNAPEAHGMRLGLSQPNHSRRRQATPQLTQNGPFQLLHKFQNSPDGAGPNGALIFDSKGNLYGTTAQGGSGICGTPPYDSYGCGTIFELSPNGSGAWTETILYSFQGGSDGQYPQAGLIFDQAGNLYGATQFGGSQGVGTIFELSPEGSGGWTKTILYSFGASSADGAQPSGGLIFDSNGFLFGTTTSGGSKSCHGGTNNCGTVFELYSNGHGSWFEDVLYNFGTSASDGFSPNGALIFDHNGNEHLYGTTAYGGAYGQCDWQSVPGCGTAFEVNPIGSLWEESILHNFQGGTDGQNPQAGLTFDQSGNLYGTTLLGGTGNGTNCLGNGNPGCGTVFELSPIGSGGWTKSVLYNFQGANDGYGPYSAVVFDSKGNLYGTTGAEQPYNTCTSTVFEMIPSGSGGWTTATIYCFPGAQNAAPPNGFGAGGVILDQSSNLYGTTGSGGTGSCIVGCGVAYELLATPPDFSVTPGLYSRATATPGQTAQFTVTVAPLGGFSQTVTLSCTGAPTMSTCSVSPSSVKLTGPPVTVDVAVATTAPSAGLTYPAGSGPDNKFALWLTFAGLPSLLLFGGGGGASRVRRTQLILVLSLLCVLGLAMTWSGCGGGSGSSGASGTPLGTYTLTVTGTYSSGSTNLEHSAKLTLVVQ